MSPLPRAGAALFFLSSFAWLYYYLFPVWQGCGFAPIQLESDRPRPPVQFPFFEHDSSREPPFRLLVLADPQLEGDSSLPKFKWSLSSLTPPQILSTLSYPFRFTRKKLDLWGNDRYLAHVYRSLRHFTNPTHVTVLGDLLGSQWVTNEEFEHRADRFWNTVFAGSEMVPEYLTRLPLREVLGQDQAWRNRIISIAGNHDIGYAGDMTEERVERFERRFGRSNWEVEFELPASGKESEGTKSPGQFEAANAADDTNAAGRQPSIRVFVLNSMNLDTPAYTRRLQDETYAALNGFISRSQSVEESESVLTLVLTHVPLFKRPGVCIDGPFFNFYPEEQGGGIKEQNHLSDYASRLILENVYGVDAETPGRRGLILNGHDHEGCDVWHYLPSKISLEDEETFAEHRWNATRWHYRQTVAGAHSAPGIREVTLRAMMGEYEGNAAFLSAWYDEKAGHWSYDVLKCAAGSQHIWWAVHVLFLVSAAVGAAGVVEWQATSFRRGREKQREARAAQKANAAATKVAKSPVKSKN